MAVTFAAAFTAGALATAYEKAIFDGGVIA
jgi:hypothetical protein